MTDEVKNQLNETIKNALQVIDDFNFVLDHQEFYLDDYISKVKNEIDIQREEIIQQIHKISHEMINKLDTFFFECKSNLPHLRQQTSSIKNDMSKLKSDLIACQHENHSTDIFEHKEKTEKIMKQTKSKMNLYKHQLRMNKKSTFDPVYFNDVKEIFGQLYINDIEFKPKATTCFFKKSFLENLEDEIHCMELMPNGKIALGNERGEIKVLNINSSECLNTLKDHKKAVNVLKSVSKSVIVSGSQDKTIKFWDLNTNSCMKTIIGHQKGILDLCLDLDKTVLVSTSIDKTVKIWRIDNYQCVAILNENSNYINQTKINSKNELIGGCNDGTLKFWDIKSFDLKKTIVVDETSGVEIVEINSNEDILTLSGFLVKLWDGITCTLLKTFKNIFDEIQCFSYYVKFLDDNSFISVQNLVLGEDYCQFQIWKIDEEQCIYKFNSGGLLQQIEYLKNDDLIVSYARLFYTESSDSHFVTTVSILNMN